MASIVEVWGSSFTKRAPPISSAASVPVKENKNDGRVYASPQERSAASINSHRKDIDDLSNTLPIVKNDDEAARNFPSSKYTPITSASPPLMEHFGSQAYAPPGFQSEMKLRQLMQRLDQDKSYGGETNATHDMMLHIFTGIFFLFTLDSFVNMGRRMRR